LTKSHFGGMQKEEQTFFDNRRTFKKSIRKISFKTEAVGTVWLNARRPSIKAELNLLKIKPNRNFIFNNKIYNHYKASEIDDQFNKSSLNDGKKITNEFNLRNQSKMKNFFQNALTRLTMKFNRNKI
jgi:hypothetical protein